MEKTIRRISKAFTNYGDRENTLALPGAIATFSGRAREYALQQGWVRSVGKSVVLTEKGYREIPTDNE